LTSDLDILGDDGLRRRPQREQLGYAREVLAQGLEHPRRVQRGGGVVDRVQAHGAASDRGRLRLTVQARDSGRISAQELRREVAERADHVRLDQLDLAYEVLAAVLDLDRERIAVAGCANNALSASRRSAAEDSSATEDTARW